MVWFYVLLLCQISATRFHDFSFEEINDHARALVGRFASVHLASELWGNELVYKVIFAVILSREAPNALPS